MKLLCEFITWICLLATGTLAQLVPPVTPKVVATPSGQVHLDLEYVAGSGPSRTLDLYIPEKGARPFPVIVQIHGGAWYSGSKGPGCRWSGDMLRRGYAVASINYRLCQEAPFPAQIHDCKAAVRWLRAQAEQFHIDPNRIGCWGGSAGGHLAALLGVTGDEQELEGDGGNLKFSSRVQAVCDWFGPTELVTPLKSDPNLGGIVANLLGGAKLATQERAAKASPVTYVSKTAAPFLIMHGDKDNTVPLNQSEILAAALKKAGVDCTFVVVPGAGHGLGDKEFENHVMPFFEKYLKPVPAKPPVK